MSIVEFQTSVMLERDTFSTSSNGQNVTEEEVLVSDSSISTYADDGEKIFDTAFGAKEDYRLFNYTEDSTENISNTYSSNVRTAEIGGYTRNRNLLEIHRKFARYLPLILVHMYPNLYQRAKETITNMTRADYLFIISYPNYSGYRVEHDPVYVAYFAPAAEAGPKLGGLLLILTIGVIVIAVVFVHSRRKKSAGTQID